MEQADVEPLGETIVNDLNRVLQATGGVVDQIRSDQLPYPTPCSDWTVQELLNHVVAVSEKVYSFVSGETDHPRTAPGDRLGDDWRGRYWETAHEVMSTLRHSVASLRRTCYLPYGTFPGDVALAIYLFDILVHGWDLASAVKVPYAMDEKATHVALEVARLVVTAEGRGQGHYGPPHAVPPDATTSERLLAITGRNPRS